jgi:hypothetical protein
MTNRAMIAAAVVVTLFIGGLSAAPVPPPPAAPLSPPPSMVFLDSVDKENQLVTISTLVCVPVAREVEAVVKTPDNKVVTVKRLVTEMVTEIRKEHLGGKGMKILDAAGNPLDSAEGWDRLKPRMAVLVSDTPKVDRVYLKLLARDALILVPAPRTVPPADILLPKEEIKRPVDGKRPDREKP